eukprot:361767-Chlamydomonas_euryale.AAC.7
MAGKSMQRAAMKPLNMGMKARDAGTRSVSQMQQHGGRPCPRVPFTQPSSALQAAPILACRQPASAGARSPPVPCRQPTLVDETWPLPLLAPRRSTIDTLRPYCLPSERSVSALPAAL